MLITFQSKQMPLIVRLMYGERSVFGSDKYHKLWFIINMLFFRSSKVLRTSTCSCVNQEKQWQKINKYSFWIKSTNYFTSEMISTFNNTNIMPPQIAPICASREYGSIKSWNVRVVSVLVVICSDKFSLVVFGSVYTSNVTWSGFFWSLPGFMMSKYMVLCISFPVCTLIMMLSCDLFTDSLKGPIKLTLIFEPKSSYK